MDHQRRARPLNPQTQILKTTTTDYYFSFHFWGRTFDGPLALNYNRRPHWTLNVTDPNRVHCWLSETRAETDWIHTATRMARTAASQPLCHQTEQFWVSWFGLVPVKFREREYTEKEKRRGRERKLREKEKVQRNFQNHVLHSPVRVLLFGFRNDTVVNLVRIWEKLYYF